MTIRLFNEACEQCSKTITKRYSTSFSGAIRLLQKELQQHVYNIYGFVRFADEIVDTFHGYDQQVLLNNFREDTDKAIESGISLNPILNSFQNTVNRFGITPDLINAFFNSMETDLHRRTYDEAGFKEYIYGSAEVVGLMCLHVFCEGDELLFKKLKPGAQSLGAAFQKVNFLRDFKADHEYLSRIYFPGIDFGRFTNEVKKAIEKEIATDFDNAFTAIKQLPISSRFGVYLAYKYYLSLFNKIRHVQPAMVLQKRIRIPNYAKAWVAAKVVVRTRLNLL